ncbi:MAG: hypothetical protein Q4E45_00375 [Eubacteriales bacterium]|nr:hypothetical protein [Eubacteriales bacterium]
MDTLPTLAVLVYVCALSLFFVIVIPPLAPTKLFMRFLPQDIRDAARDHPDPPKERRILGYLLTAVLAAAYVGGFFLIGADALRHGCGYWRIFGRYMLVLYGYKIFDILVQDQYIVIKKKYFLRFFPETAGCKSWDDRSFNKDNQFKRLIAFPFVCALLAWITLWVGR